MASGQEITDLWNELGHKGTVAGMYDGDHKIYISSWNNYNGGTIYDHEWRHAWCVNYFMINSVNHWYCEDPHFKILEVFINWAKGFVLLVETN